MPIVNTAVNVAWINKPHSLDEITDTSTSQYNREIKGYPPLPATPPRWCEKGSQSLPSMKKKLSHSKRKSFSGASNNNKKLDFFLHRPRSFHSSLPLPPLPSPPPSAASTFINNNEENEDHKPLPAVPIDPHSQWSLSPSSSFASSPHSSSILFLSSSSSSEKKHTKHQSYADFEPLTLKDITLILDRNDRMAAYNTAYEKCISTASPLVSLLETLKKKPPCPTHKGVPPPLPSHANSASLPRRSLTLPSLPSRITKKVAILQHQLNIPDII